MQLQRVTTEKLPAPRVSINLRLNIPQVKPRTWGVVVYFKELNQYKVVSFRMFDRLLHNDSLTHTNNYGWFCK